MQHKWQGSADLISYVRLAQASLLMLCIASCLGHSCSTTEQQNKAYLDVNTWMQFTFVLMLCSLWRIGCSCQTQSSAMKIFLCTTAKPFQGAEDLSRACSTAVSHLSLVLMLCILFRAQLSVAEQQSSALKQQQEGAEDLVRFLRQELHNLRQDTIGVAAGTRQAISEKEALQAGPSYPFAVDPKTFVT